MGPTTYHPQSSLSSATSICTINQPQKKLQRLAMETLSNAGCLTTCTTHPFPRHPRPQFAPFTRNLTASVLKTSPPPALELVEEDVLKSFLKERALNGDFISRVSDMLWQKDALKSVDVDDDDDDPSHQRNQGEAMVSVGDDANELTVTPQQTEHDVGDDDNGGFLKLLKTQEWVSGDNPPPMNMKARAKAFRDDSERRKKLNLLQYEAIKREMLLLSVSIGTACSGYCLIALSVQAAISYAVGVLFSCLYLQLLYRHTDSLSKEMVPQIFMKKKTKKIGIESEDLEDALERTIRGSGMALSSPRLVIPAAIYGLWTLCHQSFVNNLLDFQLTPAMVGLFVYKAAALVQVYRDNEDLQLIIPDDEGSSDR